MEILLQNGANINEKDVKNISVGETEDFEKERERAKKCNKEMRESREDKNSCISPFSSICEPINSSFHRKMYIFFFLLLSFSSPLSVSLFLSFFSLQGSLC